MLLHSSCAMMFTGVDNSSPPHFPGKVKTSLAVIQIKRVFITNVKGTFLGMSESEEASKRR